MTAIISREEALERGMMRYFTGKPCKHGHVSEKYVSNGRCCECKRERQREARKDPEVRAAENERKREARKDPEVRAAETERKRERRQHGAKNPDPKAAAASQSYTSAAAAGSGWRRPPT